MGGDVATQSPMIEEAFEDMEGDEDEELEPGTQVALLERRVKALEMALDHSKSHSALLITKLQEAKGSIEHLGEEADQMCNSLTSELAARDAEIEELRRGQAPLPPGHEEAGDQRGHFAALRREIRALRAAEEASWARHAATHDEVVAHFAEFREMAEEESSRLSALTDANDSMAARALEEEARHRAMEEALHHRTANETTSRLEAEAANLVAASLREDAVSLKNELVEQLSLADSKAEAAQASSLFHANEVLCFQTELLKSRALAAELSDEHEQARLDASAYEELAQGHDDRASELRGQLAQRDEALAAIEGKLRSSDDKVECELLAHRCVSEELRTEAGAYRQTIVARRREIEETDSMSPAALRWSRLFLIAEVRDAERWLKRGRTSWTAGCRKARTKAAERLQALAANPTRGELERICEQGEKRLLITEQLHRSHVENAAAMAATAAKEFKDARAAWTAEASRLRGELRRQSGLKEELRAERDEVARLREELSQAHEAIGRLSDVGGEG